MTWNVSDLRGMMGKLCESSWCDLDKCWLNLNVTQLLGKLGSWRQSVYEVLLGKGEDKARLLKPLHVCSYEESWRNGSLIKIAVIAVRMNCTRWP